MSASSFALTVVVVLVATAVPPLVFAHHRGRLSASLVALPFVPAVIFEVALLTINVPAQTGWGSILYPFFTMVLGILVLYLWVYLIPLLVTPASMRTGLLLAIVCVAAFVFGVMSPPWYE